MRERGEPIILDEYLTEEDLINDYLTHIIEKLDQKVIDARKNTIINGVIIPYYLELEKEIRLIYIYKETHLKYLTFRIEDMKKIKELKRKDVKIVLLTDDISKVDINIMSSLCTNTANNTVTAYGEYAKYLLFCKEVEIHEYKGWILKNHEE